MCVNTEDTHVFEGWRVQSIAGRPPSFLKLKYTKFFVNNFLEAKVIILKEAKGGKRKKRKEGRKSR